MAGFGVGVEAVDDVDEASAEEEADVVADDAADDGGGDDAPRVGDALGCGEGAGEVEDGFGGDEGDQRVAEDEEYDEWVEEGCAHQGVEEADEGVDHLGFYLLGCPMVLMGVQCSWWG